MSSQHREYKKQIYPDSLKETKTVLCLGCEKKELLLERTVGSKKWEGNRMCDVCRKSQRVRFLE
jgi:transcription elongation factor Elf1